MRRTFESLMNNLFNVVQVRKNFYLLSIRMGAKELAHAANRMSEERLFEDIELSSFQAFGRVQRQWGKKLPKYTDVKLTHETLTGDPLTHIELISEPDQWPITSAAFHNEGDNCHLKDGTIAKVKYEELINNLGLAKKTTTINLKTLIKFASIANDPNFRTVDINGEKAIIEVPHVKNILIHVHNDDFSIEPIYTQ